MSIPGSASPLFFQTAAAAAPSGGASKSVRFNNGDSPYLNRTPSSASNRRTWTWAGWVKRGVIDASASRTIFSAGSGGFDVDLIVFYGHKLQVLSAISSINWNYVTTALFRDPSAWYHITVAVDTTNSTASDRVKIYVNGTRITDFGTSVAPSQNYENNINSTNQHAVSYDTGNIGYYFDGYMTDVYLIDGQQLDPTSFGAFDSNGVWQSATYSGTFGTNGFHLFDFANESGIGNDSSGNDNDFSVNNISSTAGAGNDVLFDVPVNGTQSDTGAGGEVNGNYCTLNPLTAYNFTLSQGNLTGASTVSAGGGVAATIGVSSGKWYWELSPTTLGSTYMYVGVFSGDKLSNPAGTIDYPSSSSAGSNSFAFRANGSKRSNGSETSYGNSWGVGDVVGIAVDMDNGKIWFSVNGTFQASGNPAAGTNAAYTTLSGTVVPGIGDADASASATFDMNFGARGFAYSAPSGFKALCTSNLPTPTVADGSDYFDAALYTGNGSTQNITSLSFNPDLVWVKSRSASQYHRLIDSVRGVNRDLITNGNFVEQNQDNSNSVSAFNNNGFSLGPDGAVNTNNVTYVAWTWDAGSSTASNTDGSITSSVRANQTAGFSIVSYTGNQTGGATIGHGLNAAPEMIIVKNREGTWNWVVGHQALDSSSPWDKFIYLNSTGYLFDNSSIWNDTAPTSSVFTVGGSSATNQNGKLFIAYCAATVSGYSAVGSYVGNGSSLGPHIYTGFRPAFLLVKSASHNNLDWFIYDSKRHPFNDNGTKELEPNTSASEGTNVQVDILSNGFRPVQNFGQSNLSGITYIYYAVAENPFQANGGLAR